MYHHVYDSNIHYKYMLISKIEILRVLKAYNPWWDEKDIPPAFVKRLRRTPFYEVLKLLNNKALKRAIVLPGPRRVGKTTILYQIADYFIREESFDAKNIIYLTMEHPILKLMPIDQILELYEEEVVTEKGREKIVLLDELQYIDEPTVWLKLMVDGHPNWKMIVTGSASITFKNKDLESGVGRWVHVPVPTLSFFEYVLLREYEKNDKKAPMFAKAWKATILGDLSSEEKKFLTDSLKPLQEEFNNFLLVGGFPESAMLDDPALAQRLLREDVVDKVLKRDMAAFYKVRKLQELEKLFVYLCLHSGSMMNEQTISGELKITRQTLDSLLNCLEGAHLIRKIVGVDITGKKVLKGKTKWYVVDSSMRNAVLLKGKDSLQDPTDLGLMVEAATVNQVASFTYGSTPRLGHWHGKKEKEVDLVVEGSKYTPIAIEVKYRGNYELKHNEGICEYLSQKNKAVGILVTKNTQDFGVKLFNMNGKIITITQIPAYIFLYMMGHYEFKLNQAGHGKE